MFIFIIRNYESIEASRVALLVKNPAHAGKIDAISTPGSERPPGGGYGNSLQYFCLGNFMDRGAWWATIHRFTKSQQDSSDLAHMHTQTHELFKLDFRQEEGYKGLGGSMIALDHTMCKWQGNYRIMNTSQVGLRKHYYEQS